MNSVWLPYTILRAASLLTPCNRRAEWVKEWQSELWYIPRRGATRFCLGAFRDALCLRRDNQSSAKQTGIHLESPLSCLGFLVLLSAASIFIVVRLPVPHFASSSPLSVRDVPVACIRMLMFSCLLLPGTLAVWRRPAERHPMSWLSRLRRAIFLFLKVALVQPMMLCGFLVHVLILPLGGFGGLGFYAAFILVLRWVISDQQQRCPVCLRSLTAPVRIGTPSRTFLEWYGAESACSHGHGLLLISENASSYSRRPQWLCLDDSWRDLFARDGRRDA
jgi:hypothetical protein